MALGILGRSLGECYPWEALTVMKQYLALLRRVYVMHSITSNYVNILNAQTIISTCRSNLGQHDEALVLRREIYAEFVASIGISQEDTIQSGNNVVDSLLNLQLWEEAKALLLDRLLPAARHSLGADHDLTLGLNQNLGTVFLAGGSEHTRDDPCLNI